MPVFEYRALNAGGRTVEGLKEADSPKTLRSVLRRDGLYLTAVLGEQAAAQAAAREGSVRRRVGGRIRPENVAVVTRQLAVLVDQGDHGRLKKVVSNVRQRVNEGSSLADALKPHPRVFSDLYVNMIRAGESSGALEVVLKRLADCTESQARLRSKIAGTLTYPAVMMGFSSVILGILFTYVIPKITKVLEDAKVTLPWTTRALIAFSTFVHDWWWV